MILKGQLLSVPALEEGPKVLSTVVVEEATSLGFTSPSQLVFFLHYSLRSSVQMIILEVHNSGRLDSVGRVGPVINWFLFVTGHLDGQWLASSSEILACVWHLINIPSGK